MGHFNCKWVEHQFAPFETIRAVIRRTNSDGVTPTMLDNLVEMFNERNEYRIPKPGQVFQIPVFIGFYGNIVKDLHR